MIIAGVDLGGRKAAISFFEDGECMNVRSHEVPKTNRAHELGVLAQWCRLALLPADLVVVEEPVIGRGVQASLQVAQTFGAVLATIGDTHRDTKTLTVSVTAWKKTVVGKGNANKESVAMWLKSSHPAYAVLCGANQDRIDATCIGLYGVHVADLSKRLGELG